ncbi:MAG: DUF924 domain-containing protein [Rickettsiales bacterium]|nr:DUF924 domain-containing protein [Rickettsiales bacterium]
MPITPKNILDFWFSDRVAPLRFKKNAQFDQEIYDRFFSAYEEAVGGMLSDWQQTADGCLALIILLDQFPRNMFRSTPKSFATDGQAIEISKEAINKGSDIDLTQEQRVFLYMPFMHSEELTEQELAVELYRKLGIESNLRFAIAHRDIVARFGRFPHRNDILKRDSTPEEIEFLNGPNSGF